MTPGPENYRGAISLAGSKYASPQRRAQFEAFPLAVSSPAADNGTIATKEQIAASNGSTSTDLASYNSDAQLAMAQNEALKEQVDKHSASFVKSVSSAVNNTRHLLTLVRESIKKDSLTAASELATVDDIWKELEQLFEAAKEAKNALPTFLEKQKDNMSLYHNSVINETMRESQAELDLQHKKVNLQHSLILEHQQAFTVLGHTGFKHFVRLCIHPDGKVESYAIGKDDPLAPAAPTLLDRFDTDLGVDEPPPSSRAT